MVSFASSGGERGIDPSSFQISVVMEIRGEGVRVPLWTRDAGGPSRSDAVAAITRSGGLGSGSGSGPLSASDILSLDLPIVQSVTMELSLGLVGKINVDIAATYDLGLLLLDSPFFQIGNLVDVQIGYQRSQRYTHRMVGITSKPSIRISADEGMMATLNVEGGGFPALRGVSNRKFTGKSYKQIIIQMASELKWEVDGLDDILSDITRADLIADDPLFAVRDEVGQENMTDWFFIRHICYLSGCHAYMGPTSESGKHKLFISRRRDAYAATPRYKFVSRGSTDFITTFPALEFETEAEFVWLPGGSVRTTTQSIDPQTKKVEKHDASANTSPDTALGDGGSPTSAKTEINSTPVQLASADGAGRTGEYMVVSARDPRRPKDVVQAHRDELAVRGGITAKVTSFGIPELLPGELVQLEALGIFNGLYGINSLTHTANDTEWSMTMDLINNASASAIFEKYFVDPPASADKTNTKNVDESGAEGGGSSNVAPQGEQ
jgi:hypothetical protein